jgi:phage tail sheath protein FI
VFGSRTLVTLTEQQWRYVPVRRTALFLEQSLLASLKWVVFEPNADPLWSAIRLSITAFMLGLFNQGAFQGTTPSQAFLVQCDSQTTTQADIDNGIVNIIVGFAPLLPAEFVIISIAQLAGQSPAG